MLLVSIFELLMFISFALLYLFRTLVVQLCCSALAPKATCFIWFHLEPSPLKRMSKRLHRYFQKHQTNCSTYLIHFLIILHIHLCHFLCSYRKPLTSIHFLYSRIHSFLYFLLRSFIFFFICWFPCWLWSQQHHPPRLGTDTGTAKHGVTLLFDEVVSPNL